ncbi:MAG: amidohydrolase family protein [Proteobacteria bacterium]|nr:amidohydrolase family protein [Pseudomonadota bacterium]
MLIRLAASLIVATMSFSAGAATRYVHAGKLVDTEHGRVLDNQLITIVDGRVAAVAPFAGAPSDGPLTDWSRYQVLPGLIDMHTHLADYGETANVAEPLFHSAAAMALKGADNARKTLRAGFTTVRDVGTYRAFTDVALRDAIAAGQIEGPRMFVAGAYITVPGGGGTVSGFAPDVKVPADMQVGVVRNADEAREKTRHLFQNGADFIKMIATGAVLTVGTEPGQPELSFEEMKSACEEAALHGSYCIAHAHGAAGIKSAIRAGVRSIEHASLIDDEGIALAKAKGVWLDMDIYDGDYIEEFGTKQGWDAGYLRKNRETTDLQRAGFAKALKAGVKLSFGTDEGVYPFGWNARQFAYMVRYGMTPMQAIQSATTVAADLLRVPKDVGALSPGHYADMIAIEGDATVDVRALEKVAHVMKGGTPVD